MAKSDTIFNSGFSEMALNTSVATEFVRQKFIYSTFFQNLIFCFDYYSASSFTITFHLYDDTGAEVKTISKNFTASSTYVNTGIVVEDVSSSLETGLYEIVVKILTSNNEVKMKNLIIALE